MVDDGRRRGNTDAKARSIAKADGDLTDIESVTEGSWCDDGFVVFVGCSKRTGEDSELGVGLDEAKLLHEARVTDNCSTAKRVGLGEALEDPFGLRAVRLLLGTIQAFLLMGFARKLLVLLSPNGQV